MTPVDARARLEDVLEWSRARNYAGYDYADGLSSRLLQRSPFQHRALNLGVQEFAKRMPVNVRPILAIPHRRSFKGTGLFVEANVMAYRATGNTRYRSEAIRLARWLIANRRADPPGWGHNHRLQTLDGTVPRNTPSIVTTTYVVRGLLALRQIGMQPPFACEEVVRSLVLHGLSYDRCAEGATIDYRAQGNAAYTIVNANALGAALLTEVGTGCADPRLRELAGPLFEYVASRQAENGGWHYADPPTASHLSMDSHHNGFILESFLVYRHLTGDRRFDDVIEQALSFHREKLFEENGAPRWDESTAYPQDVHAAAQGIITFTRAGNREFARRIFAWTETNLHREDGRYVFRKGCVLDKNFTLMRWSQAWMARALGTLIAHDREGNRLIPNPDARTVR